MLANNAYVVCGPGADADINWEESQSYASASSTALSARSARDTATSRPGSAAAPLPGSWLRPGSGAAAADLSDLDDNPFAAGSSAGAGLGLGSGQHEARYDEDGFLIDSAEASRRTSRASAGGDARSGAAEVPTSAAARISRWSVDSSGRGSGVSEPSAAAGAGDGEPGVSPGAAGAGLGGGMAAATARGTAGEPHNAERASDDDSEEDFLAQVRSSRVCCLPCRKVNALVRSKLVFLLALLDTGLPS